MEKYMFHLKAVHWVKKGFLGGSGNLPKKKMQVLSLGQEDLLQKEMTNPLQYSCLGNSMDSGAWQASVHGVAKSLTWLATKHRNTLSKRV